MNARQLKEFCRRLKNSPQHKAIKAAHIRQLVWKIMDEHGMGLQAAIAHLKHKIERDPEFTLLKDNITRGVEIMRRKQNPHLTSGKWRFVGMFEKGDIPSVRRILKIHGMKNKVTRDQLKREPGMRELYVERGGYDTAYRAITRLFEGSRG